MLYAFGSNGSGQLGIGHKEDVSEPVTVNNPGEPICIAAGGNHTVAMDSCGRVLAAGENANGRCATGPRLESCAHFAPCILGNMEPFKPIIELCAATWEASTFVSNHGIFSCGTGAKGELGLGENVAQSPEPQAIPDFPPPGARVVDISASMSHTIAVLDNGDVYGWGNGRKGQLGEPTTAVWSPRKISGIGFRAHRVACGREFTFIIGDPHEGRLAVLGSDKWDVKSAAPPSIPDYVDIGAGWSSIYVLLNSGNIVAWGRNDHGQLPPHDLPPVEMMAVGSEHVTAKTKQDKLIAWGWGEHGNCGTPTDSSGNVMGRWNEIRVGSGTVNMIAAGCATSFVWTMPIKKELHD